MKTCPHCQTEFSPKRPDQVYCRPAHRIAHYAATVGDGGLRGRIKTVRMLANGGKSVLVTLSPESAANAFQPLPGQVVEVVQR